MDFFGFATSSRVLLLTGVLSTPLHLWNVENRSPPSGTFLWPCQGRTPDWCCRKYLWAQLWYPFQPQLPVYDTSNFAHRAQSVEAIFTSVFNTGQYRGITSDVSYGSLKCFTTEPVVRLAQSELFMSSVQLFYPCKRGQRLIVRPKTSVRDPSYQISKGVCKYSGDVLLRMFVRWRPRISCIRALPSASYSSLRARADGYARLPDSPRRLRKRSIEEISFTIKDVTSPADPDLNRNRSTRHDTIQLDNPIIGHIYEICASISRQHLWVMISWDDTE